MVRNELRNASHVVRGSRAGPAAEHHLIKAVADPYDCERAARRCFRKRTVALNRRLTRSEAFRNEGINRTFTTSATEWHASSNAYRDEDHMLYILAGLITGAFILSGFVSVLLVQDDD